MSVLTIIFDVLLEGISKVVTQHFATVELSRHDSIFERGSLFLCHTMICSSQGR